MSRVKHVDIEQRALSSKRSRGAPAAFIPSAVFYCCVVSSLVSMGFSASVAAKSKGGADDAFSLLPHRRFALLVPAFHVLYASALRCFPSKVFCYYHYSHNIFGLFSSTLYVVMSIYFTITTWRRSSVLERVDVMSWIFISFLWLVAWIYSTSMYFYLNHLKENPLRLLLFLRCVCIPPVVKKVMLICPFVVTAGGIYISVIRLRHEECSIPLDIFALVAALVILLLGMSSACILFFGREHPVLEADEDDIENIKNGGLDDTTDSRVSSENVWSAARPPGTKCCAWLSLRVILRVAGFLHAVAFVWACIGIFWRSIFPDDQCNDDLQQTAIVSETCLFVFVFVDLAVFYLFKIESCFPSSVDSKLFHSPFVEKGLKLCKTKIENARRAISQAKNPPGEMEYSRIVDIEC